MATLAAIKKQIEKLQEEAARIRKSEASEAIARVRELVEQFGLTPQDVFGRGTRGGKGSKRAARKGVGVAKYRDPKTGATWTGQGRAPKWIANKKDRSAFLIDGAVTAESVEEAPRKTRAKTNVKNAAGKKTRQAQAKRGRQAGAAPAAATAEAPREQQG